MTPERLRELQDARVYGEHASAGECSGVAWEVRTHPNHADGWRVCIAVTSNTDVRVSIAKNRVNYRGVSVVGWTTEDGCVLLHKFVRGPQQDAEVFAVEWADRASREEIVDD